MLKRKFKGEFDFFGLLGFIRDIFNKYGLGEIRFYPASDRELFTEIQLVHAAPRWDINDPGGFIFAWRNYKKIVRKVTFDQFSKHESKDRRIRVTIDLDKQYISLEKNIGILLNQVEESLENNFGPNLVESDKNKSSLSKEESIGRKKTIGILNKGRFNNFINNKFFGSDIGIQDEGEHTLASGNEFLDIPPIQKIEIIGRDKIEQHGDKNKAFIKNKKDHRGRWFTMDNPIVWLIFSIIAIFFGLIIKFLFYSN